ncbi:uncharacterized protein LOC144712402 [Wolffia australiana]
MGPRLNEKSFRGPRPIFTAAPKSNLVSRGCRDRSSPTMKKSRGVSVGRKLLSVWRWVRRRRRRSAKHSEYMRLLPVSSPSSASRLNVERTAMSSKTTGLGRFFSQNQKPTKGSSSQPPPKGYLAVHVGLHRWEQPHRAVVPVYFFNHPLFEELLQKAEKEFGFHQPGAITIPCQVSDFEGVCTVVAAEEGQRRRGFRRRFLSLKRS